MQTLKYDWFFLKPSLTLSAFFATICSLLTPVPKKTIQKLTSAKLLHCLYQQQRDNLEAMHHIARPPSLHAEWCQSCHLAGELHTFTFPLFELFSLLFVSSCLYVFSGPVIISLYLSTLSPRLTCAVLLWTNMSLLSFTCASASL